MSVNSLFKTVLQTPAVFVNLMYSTIQLLPVYKCWNASASMYVVGLLIKPNPFGRGYHLQLFTPLIFFCIQS